MARQNGLILLLLPLILSAHFFEKAENQIMVLALPEVCKEEYNGIVSVGGKFNISKKKILQPTPGNGYDMVFNAD